MTTEERKEWLEERRKGLGGSDTPVILLGEEHPFTTPRELWEDKVHGTRDTAITPAMRRGIVLEDVVAKLYAEETGRKLRRVNKILSHKEHPWLLANIDREIIGDERGPGVLEIKCPGIRTFSRIKREGVSDYYLIQLMHYLTVTGRSWGALAVFSAEAWELIHFDVEFDEELARAIIEMGRDFWNLVVTKTPPPESIPDVKLPKVGTDDSFVQLDDDEAWTKAVREYRETKALLDEVAEMEKVCKERIANLMTVHSATVAEGGGMRWHKIQNKGRETFDAKGFFQAHPELEMKRERFVRKGKPYELLRSYTLKGARVNE